MSNARIRAHLETCSAPVIAWLLDHGYVADDCGILNTRNYYYREGLLQASRAVQNMPQVPVPALIMAPPDQGKSTTIPRERL